MFSPRVPRARKWQAMDSKTVVVVAVGYGLGIFGGYLFGRATAHAQ